MVPPRSLLLLATLLVACGDKDDDGGAPDADGDGFDSSVDCDDADPDVNPEGDEICDGVDNDCDGLVDDADDQVDTSGGGTFYLDDDFDGYGDAAVSVTACAAPAGYTTDATDCDDADPLRNPGAAEVCDGEDNDCDEDIDEGAGGGTYYTDADGDGYGDDATAVDACTQPDDTVEVGGDCDDADPTAYPSAAEICDGVDNDCNGTTDGEGLVTFQDATGSTSDVSDDFEGTRSSPAELTLSEPGTYWLCDGTYYANVTITDDVVLRGQSGSADAVVLDGGQAGSVVAVTATGAAAELHDLTISGGYGDRSSYWGDSAGGGLRCEADASVTAANVVFEGNLAWYGGAVQAFLCDLTLSDVVVSGNEAEHTAGGVALVGGAHVFDGVEISDNLAGNQAGGLYTMGYSGAAELEANDLLVHSNSDQYTVGGVYSYYTSLSMTGDSAVTANSSRYGYGAAYVYPASSTVYATFDGVDFGEPDSADDNGHPELYHPYYGREYVVGDGATFTCDYTKCGSSTTHTLGAASNSVTAGGRVYGNIVEADEYATIDYFATYITYVGGCTIDLYILSTTSDPRGTTATWSVEWSDTDNTMTSTGWLVGSRVAVLAEPGTWYAFATGLRCSGSSDYLYYTSTKGTSVGFGSHVGYVGSTSTYSSTFGSTASLYGYGSAVQFYQYVGATEL